MKVTNPMKLLRDEKLCASDQNLNVANDVVYLRRRPVKAPAVQTLTLASGRTFRIKGGHESDMVSVEGSTGEIILNIEISESGPILRFNSAIIEVRATHDVNVECENFNLKAKSKISMSSEGDYLQQVGGNASVTVDGKKTIAANEMMLRSSSRLDLHAQGDLDASGERILLNCDDIDRT